MNFTDPFTVELLVLLLAAFVAGTVDAVVGGGGLIQIPALFAVHPGESAATLFGTNKCASVVGTANATWRYARRVVMPWRTILPAASAAFAFSYLGAAAVAWLPKDAVRPLILTLLVFAAVYTLMKKDFGEQHRPTHSGHRELFYAILLGGVIGFYDGFFGPGTGSFLIFLFVRFFGFDFLHASAGAKGSMSRPTSPPSLTFCPTAMSCRCWRRRWQWPTSAARSPAPGSPCATAAASYARSSWCWSRC